MENNLVISAKNQIEKCKERLYLEQIRLNSLQQKLDKVDFDKINKGFR